MQAYTITLPNGKSVPLAGENLSLNQAIKQAQEALTHPILHLIASNFAPRKIVSLMQTHELN